MESNLGYRPGVSKEVFACLDDEQVNVYRDICNQLVLPSVSKEKPTVIGISIGTQMQLMAGLTFCKMIKESFPDIHVVVGGNVVVVRSGSVVVGVSVVSGATVVLADSASVVSVIVVSVIVEADESMPCAEEVVEQEAMSPSAPTQPSMDISVLALLIEGLFISAIPRLST